MCEYCNNPKNSNLLFEVKQGEMYTYSPFMDNYYYNKILLQAGSGSKPNICMKINFCPMCGNKLPTQY